MKRLFLYLLVASFLLGIVYAAYAATDTSAVTVTVSSIDDISVTDAGGAITLTNTRGPGFNNLSGTDDTAARLNYTHNQVGNRKITASSSNPGSGQNITFKVNVADGAGTQTIINAGTPAAAQIVYQNITAGALNAKTVRYHAESTASGSKPGTYNLTVTYTTAAQ